MAHPSYPNYLALTSGSTWGIASDTQRTIDATHIGNLLEERGKSWKIYAGGCPRHFVLGRKAGAYPHKHVPFLSYRRFTDGLLLVVTFDEDDKAAPIEGVWR